jgi:hypothetical protein
MNQLTKCAHNIQIIFPSHVFRVKITYLFLLLGS